MKFVIRRGCFETNSSSMHSVTINMNNKSRDLFLPPVNSNDNKVHVKFGEFNWGYDEFTDPINKLSYAITMALQTEYRDRNNGNKLLIRSKEDFYKTKGFKTINEAVSVFCNCDGIELDSDLHVSTYDECEYLVYEGGIDHQSCEDYSSLQSWLDDNHLSIDEFLFDTTRVLVIDNDNYPHNEGY